MCEQCGRVLKNNAALAKHTFTHTRISPHKCDVCTKMFATAHKLKVHMMRHNDERNHVCPTCGLRKVTGDELRAHMRCHSKDVFDGMVEGVNSDSDLDRSIERIQTNSSMNKLIREVELDDNKHEADLTAVDDEKGVNFQSSTAMYSYRLMERVKTNRIFHFFQLASDSTHIK